jgi:hypothetical protein
MIFLALPQFKFLIIYHKLMNQEDIQSYACSVKSREIWTFKLLEDYSIIGLSS